MTNKQNGFTLIEMVLVLGIISAILLLAMPIQSSLLKDLEEEKFIETFRDDILFIQNNASTNALERKYIEFFTEYYLVHSVAQKRVFARREYPEGWEYISASLKTLRFKESGRLPTARTLVMYSEKERFVFTFPLGKGRFHFGKEKR